MSDSTYSGQPDRLDRAVAASAGVSRAAARRLIAAGSLFLNGQRCKVASRMVRSGDRLRVATAQPERPVLPPLPIIHEADGVIAIDKPAGMPSTPTQQSADGTALTVLEGQLAARPGPTPRLWVVHRLDAATSGVLVFATTRAAAAQLSEAFRQQRVHKRYLAVIATLPAAAAGEIDLALRRAAGRALIDPAGKPAQTSWRMRERRGAGALLEVAPRSGRMHQIRAHLAAIGHPIVGDRLYGGLAAPRLMLHATAVMLPFGDGEVTIEAAAPF